MDSHVKFLSSRQCYGVCQVLKSDIIGVNNMTVLYLKFSYAFWVLISLNLELNFSLCAVYVILELDFVDIVNK
ncbi:unnamed protein product [Ilex paraguariensis]|uniref:Uncharacterized protein n=1 Tax=Ilex paraguariensis TaxID=185542 RepID=A0ABC8TJ88_9AQUA